MSSCEACERLKELNPDFYINGMSDAICNSLMANKGLTAALGHDNCEDLHDMVECLIGSMVVKVDMQDFCSWEEFAKELAERLMNMLEALVCSDCGQWINIDDLWEEIRNIWININAIWNKINDLQNQINNINTEITNIKNDITNIKNDITNIKNDIKLINDKIKELQDQIDDIRNNLVSQDGYFSVTKVHRTTVPKGKFIDVSIGGNQLWFSGSGGAEIVITIPVTEMDLVDGIVAQPRVAANKVHGVTVAVQSAVLSPDGNTYTVNFDTYLIKGIPGDEFPYNCPIDFIVFGRKKFIT